MNGYIDRNLLLPTPLTVTPMQSAWMFVGKAFQDGHRACEECKYCAHTIEPRPYGEGVAHEFLTECTLGRGSARDVPEMCPAYLSHLEEQAEEETDDAAATVQGDGA